MGKPPVYAGGRQHTGSGADTRTFFAMVGVVVDFGRCGLVAVVVLFFVVAAVAVVVKVTPTTTSHLSPLIPVSCSRRSDKK